MSMLFHFSPRISSLFSLSLSLQDFQLLGGPSGLWWGKVPNIDTKFECHNYWIMPQIQCIVRVTFCIWLAISNNLFFFPIFQWMMHRWVLGHITLINKAPTKAQVKIKNCMWIGEYTFSLRLHSCPKANYHS